MADTLGVSRADLRAALEGGQSISEYATSLGKDPQAVVDALVNAANTKIDQLVANGKLQQERADTIKGNVPARVNTIVNRHLGQARRLAPPTEAGPLPGPSEAPAGSPRRALPRPGPGGRGKLLR